MLFTVKRTAFLFLIYYAVLIAGATILMYLESHTNDVVSVPDFQSANGEGTTDNSFNYTAMKEFIENRLNIKIEEQEVKEIYSNLTSSKFQKFTNRKTSWKKEISWTSFLKWKYFASVSLSTIGYGDIVPVTDWGRMFLIIFSIVGIPLHMLLVTTLCLQLNRLIQFLRHQVCKKMGNQAEVPTNDSANVVIISLLLVIWLGAGGFVFSRFKRFNFITGLYFAFVTFSTIGYGDFAPLDDEITVFGEIIGFYVSIGLILAGGVTNALLEMYAETPLHEIKTREMDLNIEMKKIDEVEIPIDNLRKKNTSEIHLEKI